MTFDRLRLAHAMAQLDAGQALDQLAELEGRLAAAEAAAAAAANPATEMYVFDYEGNDHAPTSGSVNMTWATNPGFPASGQASECPFDLSDPTKPLVLADGVYSITANVNLQMSGGDAGDWFSGIVIDPDGDYLDSGFRRKLPGAGVFDQIVVAGQPLAAGTALQCFLGTTIGAQRNCWLTARVCWSPL